MSREAKVAGHCGRGQLEESILAAVAPGLMAFGMTILEPSEKFPGSPSASRELLWALVDCGISASAGSIKGATKSKGTSRRSLCASGN